MPYGHIHNSARNSVSLEVKDTQSILFWTTRESSIAVGSLKGASRAR